MAAPAAELEGADAVLSCAVGVRRSVCVCMESEWEGCAYIACCMQGTPPPPTAKSSRVTAWVHLHTPSAKYSAVVRPSHPSHGYLAAAADTGRAGGVVKGSAANDCLGVEHGKAIE